ncbi:MAG: helix-turn-helix domain-containing protein [Acidobacteria bacterium]|nr:helix-turn-helix domain-containing protein [Acidobacteriota bacterium]
MMDERRTLSVEEAARVMGIGRNSAYEAIRRGELPVVRLGRRLLVPQKALEVLLSGGSAAASGTQGNEV